MELTPQERIFNSQNKIIKTMAENNLQTLKEVRIYRDAFFKALQLKKTTLSPKQKLRAYETIISIIEEQLKEQAKEETQNNDWLYFTRRNS